MNQTEFLKQLASEGFPESVLVTREANGYLENHTHSFEVKALVLDGQIDLVMNGVRSVYIAGDVFHLPYEQVHAEYYGDKGVQYLASRKDLIP
jgi:quercetin dioxygenase-like cupin family protein